jgi:ribonuclease-3
LAQALTHPSRANEDGAPADSNERLEFLGDAVVDLVVAELLMAAHPRATEGELTHARSEAVNGHALAEKARALELGGVIRLGRGEARSGGAEKASVLANAFEAVVGALYLDGGFEVARAFLEREFGEELGEAARTVRDPKSRLQAKLHASGDARAEYVTVAESGPAHAREFEVELRIADTVRGRGRGRSKQSAEQAAAREALRWLENEGQGT